VFPALECHHITKYFDQSPAVEDVSLTAQPGEFVTLLGPSGCGKTTTLRLIAGFESLDNGIIRMNGRAIVGEGVNLPPEERRIGMVFQEYAIFPHLNVAENISFGVQGNKQDKRQRVHEMLELIGLTDFAKRSPHELSGGQQQRVALARALAPQPNIILLDEPFSNLDAALRSQVRSEVHSILKSAEMTAIFVTHDQEEALSLSDRVAVMFEGRIEQIGSSQDIYLRPNTRQIASFIGEANFLPAEANDNRATCIFGEVNLHDSAYGAVDLLLRPEAISLVDPETSHCAGYVRWIEFFGHDQRIGVALDDGSPFIVRADSAQKCIEGQRVGLCVNRPVIAFPH
jgi:iron(III) transport system ATP-binding protein